MTPEEFTKDPARRETLARALADPALVEAIAIAKKLLEPKRGNNADAAPAMAASYYHQAAGANFFITKLQELTETPLEKKVLRNKTQNARTLDDLPQ